MPRQNLLVFLNELLPYRVRLLKLLRGDFALREDVDELIDNLDTDKLIAQIAPSELYFPAADRGEYFLFSDRGTIDLAGESYRVTKGDRLWCKADDTVEGDQQAWELIDLLEGESPYYPNPILGVFDSNFPNSDGDRYIDRAQPDQIVVIGEDNQEFPDGAMVRESGSPRLWSRYGDDLIQYLPHITPFYVEVETLSAPKQLNNNSAHHQELTNTSETDLEVLLPSNPLMGLTFLIANTPNSTHNLIVNETNVLPGTIYEVRWVGYWKVI